MLALHRCIQSLCMLQKYLNRVWNRGKKWRGGTWRPDHLVWFLLLRWVHLFILKNHKFQCICKFFCIFFPAPHQTQDSDQVDKEQNKHLKRALLVTDLLGFTKHCTSHYWNMHHKFFFLLQMLRIKSLQLNLFIKPFMKIWLRDLLWTVCLRRWSFLFQIMHT